MRDRAAFRLQWQQPEPLPGATAISMLVLVDECCGVPAELWEAAESLASNAAGVVLAAGNPTDPSSHMAEVCKPGSGWHVQQIRAFDTPAYTGEEVPNDVLENLVDPAWVAERKRRWGTKDPRYIARIDGDFPKVSTSSRTGSKQHRSAR